VLRARETIIARTVERTPLQSSQIGPNQLGQLEGKGKSRAFNARFGNGNLSADSVCVQCSLYMSNGGSTIREDRDGICPQTPSQRAGDLGGEDDVRGVCDSASHIQIIGLVFTIGEQDINPNGPRME